MNKKRYLEEYQEGSELLWPSEKEDKITRKFYRDLSHLSKTYNSSKRRKNSVIEQVLKIVFGQGGSTNKTKNEKSN